MTAFQGQESHTTVIVALQHGAASYTTKIEQQQAYKSADNREAQRAAYAGLMFSGTRRVIAAVGKCEAELESATVKRSGPLEGYPEQKRSVMQARMDHAWMPRTLDHLARENAARTSHGRPPLTTAAPSSQRRGLLAGGLLCAQGSMASAAGRERRGSATGDQTANCRQFFQCAFDLFVTVSL